MDGSDGLIVLTMCHTKDVVTTVKIIQSVSNVRGNCIHNLSIQHY